MRANSLPGSVFALDLSRLKDPKVTVWTVRWNQKVVGIGTLKELSAGCGELKSIRTDPDHLRRSVAGSLLDYMIIEVMQGLSSVVLYYENQRGTRTGEFMEINADGKVVRVVANYSV